MPKSTNYCIGDKVECQRYAQAAEQQHLLMLSPLHNKGAG